MESLPEQKLDLINVAIQRLMEQKKSGHDKDPFIGTESEDHHLLLSELLSQLESLKGDAATDPPVESSPKTKETSSMASALVVSAEGSCETPEGTRSIGTDEIVKELKEVKKQNRITHWLLSIMIVLTVTWQVSEVSLLLKLKDGLSHPFRSVGSMLTGMFKGRRDGEDSPVPNPSDMLPIPPVKIPELPKIDVTDLSLKGEENN